MSDSVESMQTRLHILAFTRGKCQLSTLEVEDTHVECVIGECVRSIVF